MLNLIPALVIGLIGWGVVKLTEEKTEKTKLGNEHRKWTKDSLEAINAKLEAFDKTISDKLGIEPEKRKTSVKETEKPETEKPGAK